MSPLKTLRNFGGWFLFALHREILPETMANIIPECLAFINISRIWLIRRNMFCDKITGSLKTLTVTNNFHFPAQTFLKLLCVFFFSAQTHAIECHHDPFFSFIRWVLISCANICIFTMNFMKHKSNKSFNEHNFFVSSVYRGFRTEKLVETF